MDQLFDFGHASAPDETSPETSQPASRIDKHRVGCPASGQAGDDGCLCHAFDQDAGIPDLPDEAPAPEWNNDFSSWLPHYQKPAHACEYCRSRSLECFIYNNKDGKSEGCSPCNALFRPCSFNSSANVMVVQKSRTSLDTLDMVAEHSERLFGGPTGKKPLRSLGYMGPIEDEDTEDRGHPKKGAAAARFPRAAVKILKDWLIEHIDHPYPTEDDKEMLKDQTGLSLSQISNWMANTRRRQKARPKRVASPIIRPSTAVINIPPGRTWDDLSTYFSPDSEKTVTPSHKGRFLRFRMEIGNPMERWKHSPPENEPAPLQAIVDNVEHFDFPNSLSSSMSYNKEPSNDSTGSFSVFRTPSTTSLETGLTAISSGSLGSRNSAYSHSSRHSLGSFNSLKSKERRRRRRMPTRTSKVDLDEGPRMFQCTFCTDHFKSKYDWSRHEKSLHLSLEKWICSPLGEVITCTASGKQKCVFCDEIGPSKEHLETHNHRACEEKGMEARTFYRKDHLRQHLRLMHSCKMVPSMDTWKAETQNIKSRCGFCSMNFDQWQDRVDHLAKEFRNGATMRDWKGCRGLDGAVAAHVTNAMPPYLIANERKSPFPFSASNSSSMKHSNLHLRQGDLEFLIPGSGPCSPVFIDESCKTGLSAPTKHSSSSTSPTTTLTTPQSKCPDSSNPLATCWEILTLRLGRFARRHVEVNGPDSLTDAMLQSEARRIIYEEDDPWHQTAADNLEWLNLFKQAHGIKGSPVAISAQHEILEDLGIGFNAQLDPSFDLSNFISCGEGPGATEQDRQMAFECSLSGTLNMSQAGAWVVPPPTTTTAASLGLPTATFVSLENAPIGEFECPNGAGGLCIGENGEFGLAATEGACARSSPIPTISPASGSGSAGSKKFNSFMAPITETTPNPLSEPNLDDFGLLGWEQMESDFDINASTAAVNADIPVTTSGFGGMSGCAAWDDSELAFDMDLDMDIDMGMSGLGS
ncbi:hypothetical protein P280DRAFT_423491 [Massarina eburnea CBS 473.64]|uniref:Uncharacterized protein n=1 Tax=Massarina eburnea CBS 473.64 TaxID=1395130 RepID=A0A6A6S6I8_9PLEO|nr:hypothetical protein P280DRAFT_423491 [Massarina eburnea CBS 473.64]